MHRSSSLFKSRRSFKDSSCKPNSSDCCLIKFMDLATEATTRQSSSTPTIRCKRSLSFKANDDINVQNMHNCINHEQNEATAASDKADAIHKTATATSDRLINGLPLPSITEFTPYNQSNFDQSVLDLCKRRSAIYNKSKDSPLDNALFNKVINNKSCKVVLSGDVAVGKTSLVNRFGRDTYTNAYHTTIGVDFDLQKFTILGQTFILQLWDTAGLERFKCITKSYYRGCQVALLVFDISNINSLANVLVWKDEVIESTCVQHPGFNVNGDEKYKQAACQTQDEPLLFLVGTKNDLPLSESSRYFVQEQANKIAKIIKAELWFVSAQTGENVGPLFNRVAALTFNKCLVDEIQQIKFETSTLGACLKEKFILQQQELMKNSTRFIKITKKKDGDDKRSKCINIQCVIK